MVEPFLPCPPLWITINDFNVTNRISTTTPVATTKFIWTSVLGIYKRFFQITDCSINWQTFVTLDVHQWGPSTADTICATIIRTWLSVTSNLPQHQYNGYRKGNLMFTLTYWRAMSQWCRHSSGHYSRPTCLRSNSRTLILGSCQEEVYSSVQLIWQW